MSSLPGGQDRMLALRFMERLRYFLLQREGRVGPRDCVWVCHMCGATSSTERGTTVFQHLQTCSGTGDPVREAKKRHPSTYHRYWCVNCRFSTTNRPEIEDHWSVLGHAWQTDPIFR